MKKALIVVDYQKDFVDGALGFEKAALPEAKLIVDARCTASNDDEMNEKALDILQGVQVEVQGR